MADENPNPQSTDTTSTTNETTTALGDGLAKATDPTTPPAPTPTEPPKPEAPKPAAPETYADWKVPDGYELDKAVAAEAAPIFKKLGLTQEQGQELVDLYAKHSIKSSEDAVKTWQDTRKEWRDSLRKDEQIGKLVGSNGNFGPESQLVRTVNQALDGLQNPKLVADFKDAMELTGAGDNPAFVKVLYALASKVTEGTTYVRGEPVAPNRGRPSPGAAMYPNLQSEADRR